MAKLPESSTEVLRASGGKKVFLSRNSGHWTLGMGVLVYSAATVPLGLPFSVSQIIIGLILGIGLTRQGRFLVLDTKVGTFHTFGGIPGLGQSCQGWISDLAVIEIHRLIEADLAGVGVSHWVVLGLPKIWGTSVEFARFGGTSRPNKRMWGNRGLTEAWNFAEALAKELGLPIRDRSRAGDLAKGGPTLDSPPEGVEIEPRKAILPFRGGSFVRLHVWFADDQLYIGSSDAVRFFWTHHRPYRDIRQINLFQAATELVPCLRLEMDDPAVPYIFARELSLESCIWLRDWIHREIGQLN